MNNTGNIIIGVVIAAIVISIVGWMIHNVKSGKSFCGADLGEPLNTTKNLRKKKQSGSTQTHIL